MIDEAVDAYRRCDPARGRTDDWDLLEPMLRRRLESLSDHGGDEGSTTPPRRSLGAPSRRRTVVAAASIAAIVLGALVVLTRPGSDGSERELDRVAEPIQSSDGAASASGLTGAEDLGRLRDLATDAVADDLVGAINSSSVDDALALLSSESDCDKPMQPDAAEESCGQYWSRQIAIGAEVSLQDCEGVGGRRCSLVMTSQPATVGGQRTRAGTVRLGLDDEHRLVFGWVEAPSTAQPPVPRRLVRS